MECYRSLDPYSSFRGETAQASTDETARGRALLAIGAALCWPGLGHFSSGHRRRGLWWLNLWVMLLLAFLVLLKKPEHLRYLIALVPLGIIIYLLQMLDALWCARRSTKPMLRLPPVRFVVGMMLAVVGLLWQCGSIRLLQEHFYELCFSPTPSMAPAISVGDLFLNLKDQPIKRWDIVGLTPPMPPGAPEMNFVKRVVGLPGETIELTRESVWVNGHPIDLPEEIAGYDPVNCWTHLLSAPDPQFAANGCWGRPITLASDEYFVLGDNSAESYDARFWQSADGRTPGALPRSRIVGKVAAILWPPSRWRVFEQ